jgi:signal transduction histidine kinase
MSPWAIIAISAALVSLAALALVTWRRARRELKRQAQAVRIEQPLARAVSRVHRSEEDLSQERHELAHLARVSMVGELSGAIAHELNQPLTAILSNAQAAQRMLNAEKIDAREVNEILSDIIADDKRAVLVIERMRALLTNERAEARELDIAQLTQEVLALAHSTLVASKVTVSAAYSPGVPNVLVDRVQIQQVLLNLVLNATEAMVASESDEQRRITVATTLANDGAVLVTVSDTGPGLSGPALDKVFEPFYTTKTSGIGLGLSVSRAIIDAHGGRIWAVNNPNVGATFCFTVPRAMTNENRGAYVAHGIAALLLLILGFVQVAGAQAGWGFLKDSPVGNFTDEDVAMLEEALQNALESSDTAARRWENPKTKNSGELRVLRSFTSEEGRTCKRVQVDNYAHGKKGSSKQTLCLKAPSEWLFDPGAKPKTTAPPSDARQQVGSTRGAREARTAALLPCPQITADHASRRLDSHRASSSLLLSEYQS